MVGGGWDACYEGVSGVAVDGEGEGDVVGGETKSCYHFPVCLAICLFSLFFLLLLTRSLQSEVPDDTVKGHMLHIELTSMFDSLGATLSAEIVNSSFKRNGNKPQEDGLPVYETILYLKTEVIPRTRRSGSAPMLIYSTTAPP
jgi:hypothetical protein